MNPREYRRAPPRVNKNKDGKTRQEIQQLMRRQNQLRPGNFDKVLRDIERRADVAGAFGRPSFLRKRREIPGPSRDLTFAGRDGGDSLSSVASAYSRGFSSQKPSFNMTNDGIRIRKRELLGPIVGSTGFNINWNLALNPGLFGAFPWLSTQAVGWEQYKFHKLRFCYYTRTGAATSGSVMMLPDYDAADSAPVTEQQAMDFKDAKEEAPWVVEFTCTLNPAAMHPAGARKYVRNTTVPGTDIKTYDVGKFYVITSDGIGANPWGKLFVEYDVEFFCSQLPNFVTQVGYGSSTTSTAANSLSGMVYGTTGGLTLSGASNSLSVFGCVPGVEYLVQAISKNVTAVFDLISVAGPGVAVVSNPPTATNYGSWVTFTVNQTSLAAVTMTVQVTTSDPGTLVIAVTSLPFNALSV